MTDGVPPPTLPRHCADATEPKPLTPQCSTLSDAKEGAFEGMDVKKFCDMLPGCYVNETGSSWECQSAMDICRALDGEEACAANDLCAFGAVNEGKCLPKKITWSPLDVAANWLAAVNTGVDACKDVSKLFQADENSKSAPPLLLGTVGAPYSNPTSGYDIGRDEVAVYFCKGFLPNAPEAFVCGATKFDGVCEGALDPEGGGPGPLSRGLPHYSVILDKEFDGGHMGLGNMAIGLPYGAATISGNWGFEYTEGEKAGTTYLARFTFVLDQNGYIQTLHSDFVPGTETPY